jgi:hypothetical protein
MLSRGTLRVGAVVLTAITLVAILNLAASLEHLVRAFPGVLGVGGIAAVVAVVIASVGAIWALLRLAATGRSLAAMWMGIGLALGTRLAIALLIDAPLRADAAIQNQLALDVAEGFCCFGHRPMGYPMLLGAAYGLFGVHAWLPELLSVLLGTLTAMLVWDLARQAWGPSAGALAIGLYAVMPSQVLLVTVPLSELTYALLLTATIWALTQWQRWLVPASVVAGVFLALSQYMRPTSMVLLPFLASVPALGGAPSRRGVFAAAAMAIVFVMVLAPVVAFNLGQHGALSLSTSAYGGWSLFVGANQEWNGTWNPDDAAVFAELPGTSAWERSEAAGRLALDRIRADPRGYADLAVRKFYVMWSDERYAVNYAVRPHGNSRQSASRDQVGPARGVRGHQHRPSPDGRVRRGRRRHGLPGHGVRRS